MADPFPGPRRVLEPQNTAEVRGKAHITIAPSMTLDAVMKFMQIPPCGGRRATLSTTRGTEEREGQRDAIYTYTETHTESLRYMQGCVWL